MKRRETNKLTLHRETLKALSGGDLAQAQGGAATLLDGCSDSCNDACPTVRLCTRLTC